MTQLAWMALASWGATPEAIQAGAALNMIQKKPAQTSCDVWAGLEPKQVFLFNQRNRHVHQAKYFGGDRTEHQAGQGA